MKIRIKSSLNPAIFRGDKFDRIVAGTIWEVNGEKWEHNYVAVRRLVESVPAPVMGFTTGGNAVISMR